MKTIKIQYEKKEDLEDIAEISAKIAGELFNLPSGKYEIVIQKPTRTTPQNKALHLFFENVAIELTDKGERFHYQGLKGKMITKEWNKTLVKEHIWRTLQQAYLQKKSTTTLTTSEIDEVAKPLIEFLEVQFEIKVEFPSKFGKYLNEIS